MLFINHPEYFGDESASMYKLNIEGIKKLNKEDASKLNNTDALYRCWNNYICYNTQKLGFFLTLSKRLDESNWTKGRDTHSYMNNIQTNEIGDRFAFNNFGNLLYITSHLIASIADNTEKKKIHGIMSIPIRQAIVDMWVTFFASCNLRSGVSSMISSSDLFQTFTKWMEEFYEDVPGNEPGAERTNTEMELFRGLFRIQSFGSAVRTIGIETTRRSSGMFYKDVGYIVPKEGGEEGGADDGVSVKSVKSDKTAVSAKKISVFNSSELLPIEKAPDTKAMQQTVDKMMAERKVSVPSAIQTSEKALDALMKARDNVYNEALKPATPSVLKKIDAYIQHRDLSLASGDIRGDIPVAPLGEMTLKSFGLN
jgi:hypothetical protein